MQKNFHKDLACEMRSVEEIVKPIDGCPSEMESVEYGYVNPIEDKSYVLGEACYSTVKGKTNFAHTRMAPADSTLNAHLKTTNSSYFKQTHPHSSYKIDLLLASRLDELNERLRNTLGKDDIPFVEPKHFFGPDFLINKQFQSILKLGWNYVPFVADTCRMYP